MSHFADAAEVYRCLGGVFEVADHPAACSRPLGSGLPARIDPAATAPAGLKEPAIQALEGKSDVRMSMPADVGNRFRRGEHNAVACLANGEVKTGDPVSKELKPLPLTKALFPLYQELVAAKDAR